MKVLAPDIPTAPEPHADLDRLGDDIAELSAHLEAATARLLDLIRQFDARGGWNTGFRSCAAWLSWRVGLDLGAARERVRVARALGNLPALAQALGRGELSYAKVRALTRVATPETEARLLGVGRGGTAAHVERIVRGWRRVDRQAERREAARRRASRALYVHQDEDGMMVVPRAATPEVGALLVRALDAARETLYQRGRAGANPADPSADPPTPAQQRADALAVLAETALHHGIDPGAPGERYQVVVHVDASALADPDQPGQFGTRGRRARSRGNVSAPGVRREPRRHATRRGRPRRGSRSPGPERFLRRCGARCTSGTRAAASRAADSGSARGITSATGRRAARPRSRTSLCCVAGTIARSTRRVIRSSGRPMVRCSSGDRMVGLYPRPRPAATVPDDPVGSLRARHEGQGLHLHARTACPSWLGERLDVGWAIQRPASAGQSISSSTGAAGGVIPGSSAVAPPNGPPPVEE